MKQILLTGFEPFHEQHLNPSWEVAKRLDGLQIGETHVVTSLLLPTTFTTSAEQLKRGFSEHDPDIILCLGEAGGRVQMTPERVAINVIDARIPDNAGDQPVDIAIEQNGPVAYWSTLPIKEMVAAMRLAGVPAGVSDTAGTYVCNYIFYTLMHHIQETGATAAAGFMHLPYMYEQTMEKPAPAWPVEWMVRGAQTALECVVVQRA